MVVVYAFNVAASTVAPMVSVGWTPAATMGLITNIIGLGLGGGALKIFANHLLALRKIADARAVQVDARGDAQNEKLTARVTELEKSLSDERDRWSKEMSEERRECDRQLAEMRGEMREMQVKMDGFVRQMIAFQTSEARALPLSDHMMRAMGSLDGIRATGKSDD